MTLHDVTFADGSQSRVGSAWIARWPEDILEVDGEPFTPPGTAPAEPDIAEPEPDIAEPESDTAEPESDTAEPAEPDPEEPPTAEPPAADPAADAPTPPAARRSRATSNRKRVAS